MSKRSSKDSYVVGVDMGATKVLIALVDGEGRILTRKKRSTKPEKGADRCINRMVDGILAAARDGDVPVERIEAIGIGAPGPLDPDRGVILSAPNLKWTDVPLKDRIEERVGRPVFVDNDVNIGTLGEYVAGAGQGVSNLVGIFVGTGIGGGLILDGALYGGFNGTAGEIGHMVILKDGPLCGCGSRGCLEALASRTAIVRDIRAAIEAGETSVLPELVGEDLSEIRSSVLARALRKKDPVAVRVLEEAAGHLGIAVASIVNLLSPEMVVLGGGVMEAMGSRLLPIVQDTAQAYAFPQAMREVKIVAAALGDDAGVLGAAELARRKIREGFALKGSSPKGGTSERQEPEEELEAKKEVTIEESGFGYIVIDGRRYERDVVIRPSGKVTKRKKKLSKKRHGTPHRVSAEEMEAVIGDRTPSVLVVGTGQTGGLSLGDDAVSWLEKRGISVRALPTPEAIETFGRAEGKKMAFLHVTC